MAFSFLRGLHNLPGSPTPVVATIGSFDGVHQGHQVILEQLKTAAGQLQLPSAVMLFEPQPSEYFSGEQAPPRLMLLRDKVEAIRQAGVDQVLCLQFNQRLRGMTARMFVEDVLVKGLAVKHLVVGDDFRFGCDRQGDFSMLSAAARQHGFALERTQTVEHQGERISSTRIRHLLEQGDFAAAEYLLGKPYAIQGNVVYGQQLGQQLGFPTANVQLNRYRSPLSGVFVVEVAWGDQLVNGVANIGVRPTVEGLIKPLLEVHLLAFDNSLYGERISVRPLKKLREEKKFSSLDELKQNIEQDVQNAKQFFAQ